MRISDTGLDLIKHFEQCRLIGYLDGGGVPTIAWGHTGADVRVGQTCTQQEADQWLEEDVLFVEREVAKLVSVQITQHAFDALCSFAYNVGADDDADDVAEGLGDSTLLRNLNRGDYSHAANQFLMWVKDNGKVVPGLVLRRCAERMLFLGRDWRIVV